MFFRKNKELEDLKAEAREAMKNIVRDMCIEIEAQR